tara:strand:+ start:908 stop:1981 length:1074 start_codon:yes stop_codon:yes gene_type:complete
VKFGVLLKLQIMNKIQLPKIKITILFFIFINIIILIFDYPKKFISKLIFSHDLSLLTYSVFSSIDNEIGFDMTKKKNQTKSLIILNDFTYKFFRPEELKNLDSGVSWKMLHGSIWCDGVHDIFLRLAEYTNTRVAMVALFNKKNSSPHTINFIDLDNKYINQSIKKKDKNKELQIKLKKMSPFDSTFNYVPIKSIKNDQSETPLQPNLENLDYMLNNRSEFPSYGMFDLGVRLNLLENDKFVTNVNRLQSEFSIIGKISLQIIKILPKKIAKTIYKFGIFINPEFSSNYKQFLYARLEHILLNYDEALYKYSKIYPQSSYYAAAQYWLKRIESKESVLTNIDEIHFNDFNISKTKLR